MTEPAGHGIGTSRGGLSSKIHAGVDGHAPVTMDAVLDVMRTNVSRLRELLADAVRAL